jgi:transglutaminase-like putative cysteine protease
MVKIGLVLALLFLLPALALAQDDELFDYHSLDLKLSITNNFEIAPVGSNYYSDYVSALLSWYPVEDYRQEVGYITTEPEAGFKDDEGFLFEWNQPSKTSFRIEESASLNAKNEFVKVTKKVVFPIKELDPAYSEFLAPQEIIDINDKIRLLASELAQGEDDLYSVVFRLAIWVEDNVEYDLSSITAEATQKASWVLDNRKGVCDELTSLFIAMCRSLGIPARFVTGVSYSNINLQNDGWGPHGWAEVYFPGFGWVPFDVTYKELGYLDAAHIKLKTSVDSKETSIDYSTRGRNTDIKPGELELAVSVEDKDYLLSQLVELDVEVAESETGFGSYNLLIASVKNPHDYYIATRISLANVKELQLLNDNFKSVLLRPRERKKIYWLMKVSPGLQRNYIYTFPLKIAGERGEQAETSFRAARDWKIFSEEYMRMFIITEQPEEKPYSKEVLVTCSASKSKIYLNQSTNLSCLIENNGDKTLRALSICLNDKCSTTKIDAGKSARYNYTKSFDTLGVKTVVFRAENELIEKSSYVIIELQDKPLLELINLSYPPSLSYTDWSHIKFFLRRKSYTNPRNVMIRLEHELLEEEWSIAKLEQDYDFTVILRGDNLKLGKNEFKIMVTYEDEEGRSYKLEEKLSISLNTPTFSQKIMVWLNVLEHNIGKWL